MPDLDLVTTQLRTLATKLEFQVGDAARTLRTTADRLHRRLGREELRRTGVTRSFEDIDSIVKRVREAVRLGEADEKVSRTDARAAMRSFTRFSVEEARDILGAHSTAWRTLVEALFRARTTLTEGVWKAWLPLIEAAPSTVALLHGPLDRHGLLHPDFRESASRIAHQFGHAGTLAQLDAEVCAPGLLKRAWQFTSLVFSEWCRMGHRSWSALWDEVKAEPLFEAMLVPRDLDGGSRFPSTAPGPFPAAVPEHVEAQARFVVATLGAHHEGRATDEVRAGEIQRITMQAWKDPRTFVTPKERPETPGWRAVREVSSRTYEALVERLIADDLELFFDNMQFDPERREYWRRHLPRILSTAFFFGSKTVQDLRQKFPPGIAAYARFEQALTRARRLLDKDLGALCLMFRGGVVVEFSRRGNAAYLYPRDQFDGLVRREMTASMLKDWTRGRKLVHQPDWQRRFDSELVGIL